MPACHPAAPRPGELSPKQMVLLLRRNTGKPQWVFFLWIQTKVLMFLVVEVSTRYITLPKWNHQTMIMCDPIGQRERVSETQREVGIKIRLLNMYMCTLYRERGNFVRIPEGTNFSPFALTSATYLGFSQNIYIHQAVKGKIWCGRRSF